MKLFRTKSGLAREVEGQLGMLDTAVADLDTLIARGALADLVDAPIIDLRSFDEVEFLSPLTHPGRFVIIGLNYRSHCEEIGRPVPETLLFAPASGSAVNASGAAIELPNEAATQVDYEGEIGVVIGRRAHNVAAADAWSCVAGLTPLNDVSARDVQAGGTVEAVGRAKGFATFKPIGPCLATVEEFVDPLDIAIETRVNGTIRQRARSSDMVFPIPQILEIVTGATALEPGDIICSGTPGGVAHGGAHPYLVPGDLVEVEMEGLPVLRNEVRAMK